MFASRLKLLRTEKNLTQKELADILNMQNTAISKYELGERKPDQETLKKIASYFSVSIDYLLGNSDIRDPYTEVNQFLIELKEEMEKQGLEFDETSPQELIETYKLLKEFKKKTKSN